MIDIHNLVNDFQHRFGKMPRLFSAPGRVNLIGEHTDYNEGFVLPIAIEQKTYAAIASRPDRKLRVWSSDIDQTVDLDLDNPGSGRRGDWQDYIEGMAAALIGGGASLKGADVALKTDIPIGGGLSSSAALEIALGTALVSVSGVAMDKTALALAGQKAEHTYVGIQSGIMDQFTSMHAIKGHALLLDCRSDCYL
jgi:galactokinase